MTRAGRAHPASRRTSGHRELRRISRRCAGEHRLPRLATIDGRMAGTLAYWWPACGNAVASPTSLAGCCCGRRGFASAVVFVIAVNWMMDHLPPHLPGWGFGGVGSASRCRVRWSATLPREAGWQGRWWTARRWPPVLGAARGRCAEPACRRRGRRPAPPPSQREPLVRGAVRQLHLEGIGYIIAGTFLVAAIRAEFGRLARQRRLARRRLGRCPSAALWAWLCARWSHPTLLAGRCCCRRSESRCPPWLRGPSRPHRGSPVRRHVHRRQHDGPGGRALLGFPGAVALLTSGTPSARSWARWR
jgi:hypothetical protein